METFVNFANDGLVRESLFRKVFSKLPFTKVYLAKVSANVK